MHLPTPTELPLLSAPSAGCCGGGGCGCGTASNRTDDAPRTTVTREKEPEMTEQTEPTTRDFQVTGMTCGHCASAVTEEIKQLPGVTNVAVELVAGGTSTVRVTGAEPLDDALVATALEEAGDYRLA